MKIKRNQLKFCISNEDVIENGAIYKMFLIFHHVFKELIFHRPFWGVKGWVISGHNIDFEEIFRKCGPNDCVNLSLKYGHILKSTVIESLQGLGLVCKTEFGWMLNGHIMAGVFFNLFGYPMFTYGFQSLILYSLHVNWQITWCDGLCKQVISKMWCDITTQCRPQLWPILWAWNQRKENEFSM